MINKEINNKIFVFNFILNKDIIDRIIIIE